MDEQIDWEKQFKQLAQKKGNTIACQSCSTKVTYLSNGVCETCHKNGRINTFLKMFDNKVPYAFRKHIKKDLPEKLMAKSGMYLYGPVGTGKTTAAFSLARKAISKGIGEDFKRYTSPELVSDLTNFDKGDAKVRLDNVKKCAILIIDDLGSEKMTDYTYALLYQIFDYRNEWNRFTVITSNKSLGEHDDRIASRIANMCIVHKVDGKDLRLQNGQ